MFYYYIWLKSSRGTNERSIRSYPKQPSQAQLKKDTEEWCSSFGAWSASENVCSYGWTLVRNLPKHRRAALAKFSRAHKAYEKAKERMVNARLLLNVPPFNGTKVPKVPKCSKCNDTGSVQLPPAYPRLTHTHVDCDQCFPVRKKNSYQLALEVKKQLLAKSYTHVKIGRKKPHPVIACRPGKHEITFFADPATAKKDLKR